MNRCLARFNAHQAEKPSHPANFKLMAMNCLERTQ